MTITLTKTFADAAGDPVDPTSVTLSNYAGTAGVSQFADGSVVVADDTAFTNPTPGTYVAAFNPPARSTLYAAYVEIVYLGHTFYEMHLLRSQPHDATEPILEQLAQWWLAKLATLTTANGYYQDVETPRRPEDAFWSGLPDKDLSCELQLGLPSLREEGGTLTSYAWRQPFVASFYLAGQGGTDDVTDKRAARLVHDVHALVAAELLASTDGTFCSGLAEGIGVEAFTLEAETTKQLTIVRVPIVVDYTESATDPTST